MYEKNRTLDDFLYIFLVVKRRVREIKKREKKRWMRMKELLSLNPPICF